MANQFMPSVPSKRLSAAILSTDMSFVCNNYLSWKGLQDLTTVLVTADFPSTVAYGCFRNATNTQMELFTWDPTTIGPITILARGLDYRGGTTDGAATAAKYNWPANTTIVELGTTAPAALEAYVDKASDETISGIKTFNSSPVVPAPTNATDAANKAYADGLAQAGGADASTTVKGIARASTSTSVTKGTATITIASPAAVTFNSHGLTLNDSVQFTTSGALPTGITASTTYYVITAGLTTNAFEIAATLGGVAINTSGTQSGTHTLIRTTPVFLGENDGRVLTQGENDAAVGNNTDIAVGSGNKNVTQTGLQHNAEKYAADGSGSSTAYTLTLAPIPTSLTAGMVVYGKLVNANTTTTPTLNVNGLGAKTIVKFVNTALVAGDIAANMFCTFIYDSTNTVWVLQIPVANVPLSKSNVTTRNVATASGNQTIAHGLGVIPKYIRMIISVVNSSATTTLNQSIGTYDGTTTSAQILFWGGTGVSSTSNSSTNITSLDFGGGNSNTATVTFDATNITLAWTKSGTPTGTAQIIWEAFS